MLFSDKDELLLDEDSDGGGPTPSTSYMLKKMIKPIKGRNSIPLIKLSEAYLWPNIPVVV